jgi:twitching motility protein PilT
VLELNELLHYAVKQRASDLHLKAGGRPHLRVDGHLSETEFPVLTPADTERMAAAILPPARADEFARTGEADVAYGAGETGGAQGAGRFRVSLFRQRGSVALVLRRVVPGIPNFDALGLPPVVRRLAEEQRGLILVTGPTGAGKSTTVAAMLDQINESAARHIVTIEDPIEILHRDKRSIVNQREVGSDTPDYRSALTRVLRQDPDVIFIGELGDGATAKAALSAAGTGQLVISTLPTGNALETVHHVIDLFPPGQQRQARMSLAACLRGTVSQRLLERVDGKGRIPAVEVLMATGRVFDKIVNEDETPELEQLIAEGEYYGMQTFDQSLFGLYKNGLIGLRDALAAATRPHDLRISLQQAGLPVGALDSIR